jgi:hypothetical protein
MNMFRSSVRLAVPLLALVLVACHQKDAAQTSTATGTGAEDSDTALPKPDSAGGPVTGMPSKPGPGPVGPPASEDEETALATDTTTDATAEAAVTSPEEATATPGAASDGSEAALPEPSVDDAVAVVRGYYAALAAHDTARAHAYWVQGTRPPATPENEEDTVSLSADVGAPGRLDAAAGSRYLRLPVTVTRTLRDGSTTRTTAVVTLRRSMVDGATPEQRAWRIAFVDVAAAPVQ